MVSKVLRSCLPPELYAFGSYLLQSKDTLAIPMALLQREIDEQMDEITRQIFRDIEQRLDQARKQGLLQRAEGSTTEGAAFSYDTRLLLPAMITYGYIRTIAGDIPIVKNIPGKGVDEPLVESVWDTTYSITQALLDGDMRDAINDNEFADFETNLRPKQKVAELAQQHLEEEVSTWLDNPNTHDSVAHHYNHAVEVSELHQEEDSEFRELFDQLKNVSSAETKDIVREVRNRYKYAKPTGELPLFEQESQLPYFTTQYERVGIIYEDMLGMYEGDLGIELEDDFKRAIVLMVIAAQIGLDDTDDYPEDRENQLTPVTAELHIAASFDAGISNLEEIITTYLDRAEECSTDAITNISVEYIRQQSQQKLTKLQEGDLK